MKLKTKVILVSACVLVGCSTVNQMSSLGGSRADGTVMLGYEVGMFQKSDIDMDKALEDATKRCVAWGYESAEPFGAAMNTCVASSSYGCSRTRVTLQYQCLGGDTPQ